MIMRNEDILIGSLMEETWLTLEPGWLLRHIEEGLFPHAQCIAGTWRFSSISLLRARRMRELERNFDAVPELAALVADMQEEMDRLRAQLRGIV